VDDIQATCEEMAFKKVLFSGPPARQRRGGFMTHFHDPDNNVLTLIQEAD